MIDYDHKRILVLTKYRFIGDTLLAVPLLRQLKKIWPNSDVTLLSGAAACELLQGCPYLSGCIEFDPYRESDKGWSNVLSVVRKIQRGNYDIAIICNRSFHSALLAFLGQIPIRIGWGGFQCRDWMITSSHPYNPDDPEQISYLSLLSDYSSLDAPESHLELWVSNKERDQVLAKLPLNNAKLVAFQPGASHAEKQWSLENYAKLEVKILDNYPGSQIVLIGGKNEKDIAMELVSMMPEPANGKVTNLVGELSLRQTLAALTYMNIFIGGDTAIRHCATALGVSSIALFGPTSVKKWGNAKPPFHVALNSPTGVVSDIPVDDVFIEFENIMTISSIESQDLALI